MPSVNEYEKSSAQISTGKSVKNWVASNKMEKGEIVYTVLRQNGKDQVALTLPTSKEQLILFEQKQVVFSKEV